MKDKTNTFFEILSVIYWYDYVKLIKTYFIVNGYIFTANLPAHQLVPPSAIHNNHATRGFCVNGKGKRVSKLG